MLQDLEQVHVAAFVLLLLDRDLEVNHFIDLLDQSLGQLVELAIPVLLIRHVLFNIVARILSLGIEYLVVVLTLDLLVDEEQVDVLVVHLVQLVLEGGAVLCRLREGRELAEAVAEA